MQEHTSLSARRAWIEISRAAKFLMMLQSSLSARRAWIEIALARGYVRVGHGRSPQGERG